MNNLTLYWLISKDRSSRVRWLLRELDPEFFQQQMNAPGGRGLRITTVFMVFILDGVWLMPASLLAFEAIPKRPCAC
jgi:hypothetical protein